MQPCASMLLAANAAELAAHLHRRAAALLQRMSCRTLSLASRINAPVGGHHYCRSRRRPVMPRKGAIFLSHCTPVAQ